MAVNTITQGRPTNVLTEFEQLEAQTEECRRGREVEEAYLREGNAERHRWWKLITDIACNGVALRRMNDRSY